VLTRPDLLFWLCRDGVPGGQSVTEEFSLGWPQVLSSTHGVALAWADGRSGAAGGHRTGSVDPRKLGSLRVKDYLTVVESVCQARLLSHYTQRVGLSVTLTYVFP